MPTITSKSEIARGVGITEATSADLPKLCDLLSELFAQEADFLPDREKQTAGLRLILSHPVHGRIFVARREGEIVGMVNLLTSVSARFGGLTFWLEDLIVMPECRGEGIATALLQHALRFARAMDAVAITLFTDESNERATRLYQAQGFILSDAVPMRLYRPISVS